MHVVTGLAVAGPGLPWWSAVFLGRSVHHRIAVGGQYAPLVAGAPWRLCTSVVLHVDALHLAMNASAVVALGQLLEPRIGGLRFAAWLFGSGFVAAVASHLFGVVSTDGASGGAFGLLGAAVVLGWRWRPRLSDEDRFVFGPLLLGFLAVNLALTALVPAINAVAHVAGLVAGLAVGAVAERGAAVDRGLRVAEAMVVGGFLGACAFGFVACWT